MGKDIQSNKIYRCQYCQLFLSALQISRKQRYCSRRCKNESQKRKIILQCNYCQKDFIICPHLKRNKNYCSRECYWKGTRLKHIKKCSICGKKFQIKDYLVKKGYGKFCSRTCQLVFYQKNRIKIECQKCGKELWVQSAHKNLRKFCSKQCKDNFERDYVTKICQLCKKDFLIPRWEVNKGKGLFCSRKCFKKFKGETSIEKLMRKALIKRKINFEQEVKMGNYYMDFFLPQRKIVIECDGDYWHNIVGAKERDNRRDKFFSLRGYQVYRFNEKEIKFSIESCLDKITLVENKHL